MKYVISVLTLQPTVLYVPKDILIHQSVQFHHQMLKPLKLPISQSDLLKSFNVLVNVELVKKKLITVLLVKVTELTL